MAFEPLIGNDDDLAVADLAQEFCSDDIEGAGFRRQHIGAAKATDDQRPDADRIAGANHHVVRQTDERIGPFDLPDGIDEALDDASFIRSGEEVQDDLGVRGRLADGAG